MTPSLPIVAILLLLVISLLILVRGRPAVRGTTLVACWWWTVATLMVLGVAYALAAAGDPGAAWVEPLRFTAAVGSFCPLVALLGAKRPQDRAWGFIVLSLWVMLALPAAETLLLHRGQSLELHGARAWFLWALIGLGLINMLPTRFWLPSLLVVAGQILLLSPYLPLIYRPLVGRADVWAMAAFVMALATAAVTPRSSSSGIDRVWLDFRDSFGTFWALRVAQRMNADAELSAWPVTLTWTGFQFSDEAKSFDDLPANVRQDVGQCLHNLLRRFVSDAWIASRLS